MKKKLFIISALILITCISVVALIQVREYQRRNLSKALAFEELGEYNKAKEHYREHILKNKNDYLAKIKYCKLLTKMNDLEIAVTILKNISHKVKNSDFKTIVTNDLRNNFDLLIEAYEDSSEIWSLKGNHEKSRYYLEKEFNSRHEGRFYTYSWWDTSSTFHKLEQYILFENLVSLRAKIALSYWVEGLFAQAGKVLDDYDDNILFLENDDKKWVNKKYLFYASALFDSASNVFDNGKYSKARGIWRECIIAYRKGGESDSSESCLYAMYNIALTYCNTSKYWSAIDEFKKIGKMNKEFEKDKIKDMINSTIKLAKYNEASEQAESASKLFEQETYDQARTHYRKAIKLFLKAGLEENNPEICRLNYNIAMAYIKNSMYKEAISTLEYVKNINPKYDPKLVDEKIKLVSDLIELLK